MILRLLVFAVAVGCASSQAAAQQLSATPSAEAFRASLRTDTDGRLTGEATDTSLDDIIRVVAEAADLEVVPIGTPAVDLVTVRFSERAPLDLLRELLTTHGVSFLLSDPGPRRGGRLLVGRLAEGAAPVAASIADVAPVATASVESAGLSVPTADLADAAEAERKPSSPANPGPEFQLPGTPEQLLRLVNAGQNATIVETPGPAAGARPLAVGLRPVPLGSPAGAAASPNGLAPALIDSSMLRPPTVIQIPAPATVVFPVPLPSDDNR